jgi:hypoxanthine phosphoribosyltransferase
MLKEKISYAFYGKILHKFCCKIEKRGIKFAGVFGPSRGGLPIAVHVAHHLNIPFNLTCEFPTVLDERYLIVDDICDTGETFTEMYRSDYFFASLFYKPDSCIVPDVFVYETLKWIVFPWERSDSPMKKDNS